MNPDERFEPLWTDFLEGDLGADGMADLQSLLAQHSHLQARSTDLLQTHRLLGFAAQEERTSAEVFAREVLNRLPKTDEAFVGAVMREVKPALPSWPRFTWFSWRPLSAAAAGLVIGLFSASMVFGFGVRSLEKVTSLLQESFESGPAPLVKGLPQEVNLWSGDFSELVGEQQGVKPAQAKKMVRMLRSDFEGKASSMPNRQGDLSRVIDVRPFLREANGAEVVMTLSALFNATPYPDAERYDGVVTLYALGQPGSTEQSLQEDTLARSNGSCRSMDRDPSTWESATALLLLPTDTEFVILKVSFCRWPKGSEGQSSLPDHVTFAGHFVDDVRASITIRKAVPHHQNEARP
ncbi:MAG: hypothetical protein ACOYMN_19965 [Roseimicrobium sp.]